MCLRAVEQLAAEIDEFHGSSLRAQCGTVLRLCLAREEATMAGLSDILETTQLEKVAGGFVFTEGPLWHPDGFYYFRRYSPEHALPHGAGSEGGGGAQDHRRQRHDVRSTGASGPLRGRRPQVTRLEANGAVTTLADRFEGKKLNRPNDVICHSNGSLYFTDPCLSRADGRARAGRRRVSHRAGGAVSMAVPWSIRTVWRCRRTNGRSTSRTRAGASTSTPWNWMRRATWCGGACSPTCRRTARTACPTA